MAYTRIDWVAGHFPLEIDAIARSYLDRKYPAPLPLSEGS